MVDSILVKVAKIGNQNVCMYMDIAKKIVLFLEIWYAFDDTMILY
jgi:hypothetical protein